MDDYLQLIGPRNFIRVLRDDLEAGKSIVVQTPRGCHGGIVDAVRRESTNDGGVRWIELDNPVLDDPLKYLCERFRESGGGSGSVASLYRLYGLPAFAGCVLSLPAMDHGQLKAWLDFAVQFAEYSRGVDELRRSQFVIHVVGSREPVVQNPELLLTCRIADGIVDGASAIYFAFGLIQRRSFRRLERKLFAQVCAAIALWDVGLSARLAQMTLDRLLNPEAELMRYAKQNGWMPQTDSGGDYEWCIGAQHTMDGVSVRHSAFLATVGNMDEVKNRIWNAEVAVLFPHLEYCRREMLVRYGNLIQMPVVDGNGRRIECLEDLEISQVLFQIQGRTWLPSDEFQLLKSLRDARNALAHGEMVATEDLNCILNADR